MITSSNSRNATYSDWPNWEPGSTCGTSINQISICYEVDASQSLFYPFKQPYYVFNGRIFYDKKEFKKYANRILSIWSIENLKENYPDPKPIYKKYLPSRPMVLSHKGLSLKERQANKRKRRLHN